MLGSQASTECLYYLSSLTGLVRRMALNVIRHNGPSKDSLRIRKLRASLNDDYRFELIFGKPST